MLEAVGLARIELDEQLPKHVSSIDFYFGDQRIWSVDMRNRSGAKRSHFDIPRATHPYLVGTTAVSIRDSSSGEVLHVGEAVFSDDDTKPEIVDELGNPLSINKWGRLAKTLDRFSNSHELILQRSMEIVTLLRELGKDPFIVGGTLLGGVRSGALLSHDDDADIAYLSTHTNPVDVAEENFALARELKARGYEIVHHGGAHMQLQFIDAENAADYYIDIFAAFFTPDGFINQPFHVRGKMSKSQLLPFQEIAIGKFSFPGPANVDRWLTVNYDKDWETPIPGFQLRTKPRTQRRFQNWFGSFNFKRDYWTGLHQDVESDQAKNSQAEWDHSRDWIIAQSELLNSSTVLELGSGASTLASDLATSGVRVIKSDYTSVCKEWSQTDELEYVHLNLLRLNILESLHSLDIHGSFDVVANHVLEQTSHFARRNALRLIRAACRSGGTAVATLNGLPSSGVSFRNPAKWHLEPSLLVSECSSLGLSVAFTSITPPDFSSEFRGSYAAVFSLDNGIKPKNQLSSKHVRAFRKRAARSALRDWRDRRDHHRSFHKQLSLLEKQLDDRRRDLLQLAEAADLVNTHHSLTEKSRTEVAQ